LSRQHAEGQWRPGAKRAEDLVLCTALLVLVLPLMVAIAVAIKFDTPGPALFRQTRRGSVYVPGPELAVPQARRHDPRVTRVGRVLRRTSLDELPQLFNVLKGEMSLVGPRPHALAHDARFGAIAVRAIFEGSFDSLAFAFAHRQCDRLARAP
jgi:putative colanic acid biosysnthesis UDP-glucose lipid carrier transferase